MPAIEYQTLVDAAYEADLDEDAIRNYSGRAMYGADCFGLVVDNLGQAFDFLLALIEQGEHAEDWARTARQDSMGLGTVIYWPSVSILGHPDDDS